LAIDADARAQLEPAAHAAPAAPRPPVIEPSDEVLRRLLRSGCRDGLPEARALAASDAVAWADTVARLCGEILASSPSKAAGKRHGERDGRGTLVIASTIYGIWAGIATDVLFSIDNVRAVVVPPLLGMGAGLALSLGLTQHHPLTNGEAWTIVTGLEYGSLNGALWAGAFNFAAKDVVGTSFAAGLASGAVGVVFASTMTPTQGDVEVVRSGLLWGTAVGLLGMLSVSTGETSKTIYRGMGASMDLGFLGGLALASSFDVSRNRDLIIDAGTLGGGVAGLGVATLLEGPNGQGSTIAAGGLVGVCAGMLLTIYLTKDMDRADDEDAAPVAALLGRDARGRWSWGTPGPTPVFDGLGRRVVGATFNAVGGAF
jgi:hypothetical protein